MAGFIETPRFPDDIAFWAKGGPNYHTTIAELFSGLEQRNIDWPNARCKFNLAQVLRRADGLNAAFTTYAASTIIAWHRAMKGQGYGFRFKDFADHSAAQNGTVAGSSGLLGAGGLGTGYPTYQLTKQYAAGANTDLRPILKPVVASWTIYRGGVAVTVGSSPGNVQLDTTSGIATFAADQSQAASTITPGTTTQFTTASSNLGLSAGKLVYLNGFSGADAGLVNGIAHTINSITGVGPYTWTLATNTAGKSITVGSGIAYAYPQVADILTWAGEFDVPVRFDSDAFSGGMSTEGAVYQIDALNLIELLTTS